MKSSLNSQKTLFSVVFLAGGAGSRMVSSIPKQYLLLQDKPVFFHSFEVFLSMAEVVEIVVVCDQAYESLFTELQTNKKICFARSGMRRQDSVFSGLQALTSVDGEQLICIHDAARPLINSTMVKSVVEAAEKWDAAVAAVRVKSTIKICDEEQLVIKTLDRTYLWEVQTPQVIRLSLLKKAFDYVHAQNLTVSDDVSLVELVGKPVKIVEGSYKNVKITTSEDMILLQQLIKNDDLLQVNNCL